MPAGAGPARRRRDAAVLRPPAPPEGARGPGGPRTRAEMAASALGPAACLGALRGAFLSRDGSEGLECSPGGSVEAVLKVREMNGFV